MTSASPFSVHERAMIDAKLERDVRLGLRQPVRRVPAPKSPEVLMERVGNRLGVLAIEEIHLGRHLSRRAADDALWKFCQLHRITLKMALGPSRERRIVRARGACWAYLAEQGYSLHQIGEAFGFDRSTVKYGVAQHRKRAREAWHS